MTKIGFFGGSFDPIHLGHLNLAIQMLEIHKFEQILFCPTSQSPHKQDKPPVAAKEHRRAMVTMAIAPIPAFTFLDSELPKSVACFTIDTVRSFLAMEKANDKKVELFLILGQDALPEFHRWKEVDELVKLAHPLIGSRMEKSELSTDQFSPAVLKAIKKGMTNTSMMEISSTQIRERMKEGKFCGHLLPHKVFEYAIQHKLYSQAE